MATDARSRSCVDSEDALSIVRKIASFLTLADASFVSTGASYSACSDSILAMSSDLSTPATTNASAARDGIEGFHASSWGDAVAPGLIAISPNPTSSDNPGTVEGMENKTEDAVEPEFLHNESRRRRQRSWGQEMLVASIFSHPQPLSCYCLDAYMVARDIQSQQESPESLVEPCHPVNSTTTMQLLQPLGCGDGKYIALHSLIQHFFFHKVPLTILWDLIEGLRELGLDSSYSVLKVSAESVQRMMEAVLQTILQVWNGAGRLAHTPISLMQTIMSHPPPFNAVVGKTTEVVVSGIQSVATGVGSASSFLNFHRVSSKAAYSSGVSTSVANSRNGTGGSSGATSLFRRSRSSAAELSKKKQQQNFTCKSTALVNQKLLRRLSSLNSAASVISYRELEDDTAGLSKQAKTRVQRMMHYDVSLRPFVATVQAHPRMEKPTHGQQNTRLRNCESAIAAVDHDIKCIPLQNPSITTAPLDSAKFELCHTSDGHNLSVPQDSSINVSPTAGPSATVSVADSTTVNTSADNDSLSSPFMCTPQSFPPTPGSRRMVLARGTRFADDVVFLARDQLRVHYGLASDNERTREMAIALTQGKRLAVFDADDAIAAGIDLTCGQHVVTKVGTMLYCSTRSMVPVLRNCFVYFEMTVLPRSTTAIPHSAARGPSTTSKADPTSSSTTSLIPPGGMATLSIGLSTKEMPPNTLVGAWTGSVGLYSTGQFLTAGQWCSPIDPSSCAYGERATVGCLVCLDDATAFETWDGVMVTAAVTFSVNGRIVSPPVTTDPIAATGGMSTLRVRSTNSAGGVAVGGTSDAPSNLSNGWMPFTSRPHLYQLQQAPQQLARPSEIVLNNTTAATPSIQCSQYASHNRTTAQGVQQSPPPITFTLPLLVPAEEELYPTVTLHSPATAVMCRFSAGDVLATSRSQLGAPEGVTIYAVDGSVVFEAS